MRRLPISSEGRPFIGGLVLFLVVFVLAGWAVLSWLTLLVTILVINFFRDPERRVPDVPHAVVAPADGWVVFTGRVVEDRFLDKEALKVSIFMTIFDVHVNRVPFSGEVAGVHYQKGTFLSANLDKASRENEQNAVVERISADETMVFVQVAGFIARRIRCWVQPGDRVRKGDRFGMIRFGSRLDLYVPAGCRLAVARGQHVKAGESIVCYCPMEKTEGKTADHQN